MANYSKYMSTLGQTANVNSSGKDSGLADYVKNHKDSNIGWDVI